MADRDNHSRYAVAVEALKSRQNAAGWWQGHLSSSPLATAVAVFALYQVDPDKHRIQIEKGLNWLATVQNPDGGWGDTDGADPSNLSTTLLCYAAYAGCQAAETHEPTLSKTRNWIADKAGSLNPESLVKAIYRIYGKDRTFAVPILTMCALAGCLGKDGWQFVVPLPFELAVLPRNLFRWLNLSVVSYALPALIAIGQARFHFDPPANPITRWLRGIVRKRTLTFLQTLQPSNGGFLEATPLTAFVTMSLAATGYADDPVVKKGVEFLVASARPEGGWPIDTNLATWVTTLSVNALGADVERFLSQEQREAICGWLLKQQFKAIHPFTGASPGGWGWTDLPGAVPDADDTAGALIALYYLGRNRPEVLPAVQNGIQWLLNLQNSDGGIPTFCKGWGKLPFDRSCPDITAHAIQAWSLWRWELPEVLTKRTQLAGRKALSYLYDNRQADGSWLPLWFGHPGSKNKTNPIYGTAKVLASLLILDGQYPDYVSIMIIDGLKRLLSEQKKDGSWSAGESGSMEETSLVVGVLSMSRSTRFAGIAGLQEARESGLAWLTKQEVNADTFAPIGLYFAQLWYYERLYPTLFKVFAYHQITKM